MGTLALSVAQGGKALNAIPVKQRPMLYLALEDGYQRLQRRLRWMNNDQPIPKALNLVVKATPLEAMAVIGEFVKQYRAEKPSVVLDTLGKVERPKRPGEESHQVDYAVGV